MSQDIYTSPTLGVTRSELQQVITRALRMSENLDKQHAATLYSSEFKFIPVFNYVIGLQSELNTISEQLQNGLYTNHLVLDIKNARLLSKKLRKLISDFALLEMKNTGITKLTYQLKTELIKLNRLQTSWFNQACLKN